MFKLIEKLSAYIADKLAKTDSDYENFDYYEYALIGIFSFILYTIIATILSLLLGYFPHVYLGICFLVNIRKYCGGFHMDTSLGCCIVTSFSYILVCYPSILLNQYYIIGFIFSLISLHGLNQIPRYTSKATKHQDYKQKQIKKKYILMLSLYLICNLILVIITYYTKYDFSRISIMISCSLLINKFSLSNFAFKLFDK